MKEIIEKIANDVDHDIGKFMLADSTETRLGLSFNDNEAIPARQYKNHELLKDPVMVMLEWQRLRNQQIIHIWNIHNNKKQ